MNPDGSLSDGGCPLPVSRHANVLLAHGGGGSMMHQLISEVFEPALTNPWLATRHDGAVFPVTSGRLAMTTDSFVVQPLVFPGGDIGQLAVHGTVNDLAMCGARPLHLTAGFILEEGLPTELLARIVRSLGRAASESDVFVVSADTKVIERRNGDGLLISMAGVGVVEHDLDLAPASIREGDAVLLSGDVGRHGIAVMTAREGLELETDISSDSAALWEPVRSLLDAGLDLHCLRDATRGGLATALAEIAVDGRHDIVISESSIPVRGDVHAACEILGLDPLYVANEGRFIVVLPADQADEALQAMRRNPVASGAGVIGRIESHAGGRVTLEGVLGGRRRLPLLSGEQLPRIC